MKLFVFLLSLFIFCSFQPKIELKDPSVVMMPTNTQSETAEFFDGVKWLPIGAEDSTVQQLFLNLDGRQVEIYLDYEGKLWSKSVGKDLYFFMDKQVARAGKRPNKNGTWTFSVSDTRYSAQPYAYSIRIGGNRLFFTPTSAFINGQRVKKYDTGLYLVIHDFFTKANEGHAQAGPQLPRL